MKWINILLLGLLGILGIAGFGVTLRFLLFLDLDYIWVLLISIPVTIGCWKLTGRILKCMTIHPKEEDVEALSKWLKEVKNG